jgi:ABC-type lipoprotein export system ATPase subunit
MREINNSEDSRLVTPPLIYTNNLNRSYLKANKQIDVLKEINLCIHKSEFIALMGASGSGKSTLLHLLGCLDKPSSGEYRLEDVSINKLNRKELAHIRGQRIGFIFQSFNLLPKLSAIENVMLPLAYSHRKIHEFEARQLARRMLVRVDPQKREDHLPSEMSGGEMQRVAIARALVAGPSVLLADEPTGNLDSKTGLEIMQLINEIHYEGVTIVMVTHDEKIANYADCIYTMADGKINFGENL